MRVQGFSDEVEEMLAEAGFEPCFVRDLYDGDVIQIRRNAADDRPTEMTVTELFAPRSVTLQGWGTIQWIGVLPSGRKIHCTYEAEHPMWRQPSALDGVNQQPVRPGQVLKFPFEEGV